jgi:hypothetical protein
MTVQGMPIGRVLYLAMLCVAMALFTATGCDKKAKDATPTGQAGTAGDDLLVLEYEEIDIIPGGEKQVKVKSGKAEKAEVPADSGVTAKVDDGKLTVSAAKDAKEGTHNIAIKGGKKDATLKVNVKKAG